MTDLPDPTRSIAIIGMGCRFPGAADTPAAFWSLLDEGRHAVGTIPPDRMPVDRLYDSAPAVAGRIMSRFGGYLDAIDQFDAGFFHISPREAARIDPQQRLVLETAWEALEDGGIPADRLGGRRVGVFVGQWLSDFEMRLLADPEVTDFEMTIGSGRYTTAGRLSRLLNLQGPSLTIDTACASSLTAVHLAVQSLRSGESELAFAGGVNVILNPHITIGYSQARMMAPDGQCKFCDASADGYVRSEGAGMVLLKRLDRALEDGDRIHAVIRGSAVNNDGDTSPSFGRPSRSGQEALIAAALRDAGVAPASVGYVEAHGTGTRTGDPEELAALAAVLGPGRETPLKVGSVKTNIGHTEGAAGVAGLMKAALAAKTGVLPASLHFKTPNPAFHWASSPIEVAAVRQNWEGDTRIAGINGLGIAGSNAHVIVQGPPPVGPAEAPPTARHRTPVLPLSADSDAALRALALRHADRLEGLADTPVADYCAATSSRRSTLAFRAAFVGADRKALVAALREFGSGGAAAITGRASPQAGPGVIFLAPGQGGQWTGMARALLAREPVFREAIDACEEALAELVDWSLSEQLVLEPDMPGWRLDRIEVIQPTLAALAIAYARLWMALGLRPSGVIGHSMGEVAAAATSGRLSVADALRVVVNRSALMARTSGRGGMALVELAGEELEQRLSPHAGRLCIGAFNSPRSCVVSGEPDALDDFLAGLETDGIFNRRIKVDVASHGPQMASLTGELAAALHRIVPLDPVLPMYSTVTGSAVDTLPLDAGYWARNLREPVRFTDAVGRALEMGPKAFVELGPNPVLLASVEQVLGAQGLDAPLVASERRDRPDEDMRAEGLAALWVAGVEVDWSAYAPPPAEDIPLPLYPWQRQRHWHEAAELRPRGTTDAIPQVPEEARALLHEIRWMEAPAPHEPASAEIRDWLVLGDADACDPIVTALADLGATARFAELGAAKEAISTHLPEGIVVMAPKSDAGFVPLGMMHHLRDLGHVPGRLLFVTCGAATAGDGKDPVAAEQAALIGAARVVAEEHPEIAIRLLDADPARPLAEAAAKIAAFALSQNAEPETALRGESWLVPRLRPAQKTPALRAGFALRAGGAYLVTGGLSALGLRAATGLVKLGARHLVLVSHRPLPPREQWRTASQDPETGQRIAGVLALEAAGASVETAALDVADETAVKAFLAARDREMRPRILGLIHLAMRQEKRLVTEMQKTEFKGGVAAKLSGAQILDRLFPQADPFVIYSSVLDFLPQPGMSSYAAANAGADAVAADRRRRGSAAVAIAWGPWRGLGNAAIDHVQADFERQGLVSLDPDQCDALLSDVLCRDHPPAIAVLGIDWAKFLESREGRAVQLFSDVIAPQVHSQSEGTGFAALTGPERRKAAARFVPEAIVRILSLGTGDLDLDRPLGHLGLNSLMAIELRNSLEKAVGRPLSATLAWSYPTARALIDHLASDTASEPVPAASTAAPDRDDLARDLAEVADMTDDEALALLMGGPR